MIIRISQIDKKQKQINKTLRRRDLNRNNAVMPINLGSNPVKYFLSCNLKSHLFTQEFITGGIIGQK